MKAVKVVLAVLLIAVLMNWIRDSKSFSILESLPIIGGHRPGIHDIAAIAMIIIAAWGVSRLTRKK